MQRFAQGLWIVAVLFSILPAANAGPIDDEELIRHRLESWREAFNTRDAAGACDLFAPDLSYSVPGITRGTYETMCGNFRKLFQKPDLKLTYDEPAIHEVLVSDKIAIVRLTWTLTTEVHGKQETATEEGMDIFAPQPDGRWSIIRFIAF